MGSNLYLSAVIVIFILSAIAAFYVIKLRIVQTQQRQRRLQQRLETEQRINQSIKILARALVSEQVPVAEAALRISALAEGLELDDNAKLHYVSFQKLAQEIAHIPILDEWKRLPKSKRQAFSKQITQQEEKYKEFMLKAAKNLIEDKSID